MAAEVVDHPHLTDPDVMGGHGSKKCSYHNCINGYCYYGECVCSIGNSLYSKLYFNQLKRLCWSFFQVGTVRCATSALGYQVASKGPASNLINAFAIRNIMAHYAITKVSQSVLIRCQIFDHFSCCRLRVHRRARRFWRATPIGFRSRFSAESLKLNISVTVIHC